MSPPSPQLPPLAPKEKQKRIKWTETETEILVATYGQFKDDFFKWDRILAHEQFKNKRTKTNLQDKVAGLKDKGKWPY